MPCVNPRHNVLLRLPGLLFLFPRGFLLGRQRLRIQLAGGTRSTFPLLAADDDDGLLPGSFLLFRLLRFSLLHFDPRDYFRVLPGSVHHPPAPVAPTSPAGSSSVCALANVPAHADNNDDGHFYRITSPPTRRIAWRNIVVSPKLRSRVRGADAGPDRGLRCGEGCRTDLACSSGRRRRRWNVLTSSRINDLTPTHPTNVRYCAHP